MADSAFLRFDHWIEALEAFGRRVAEAILKGITHQIFRY